jgi:hypothetical protein
MCPSRELAFIKPESIRRIGKGIGLEPMEEHR